LTSRVLKGRCLVGGEVTGEALVSRRAFTFAHGVDPATGIVMDVRSDLRGTNVKGKVLFYPFGKGSTTASSWFLETVRCGNAPAALLTEGVDLSAVIGSVMAKIVYGKTIPVFSGFTEETASTIRTGAHVKVDGGSSEVTLSD
jgi:predicted aconitase with swiveling domain